MRAHDLPGLQEAARTLVPTHPPPPRRGRVRRSIAAALVIGAAGLAAATVLARPTTHAPSPSTRSERSQAWTESISAHLANAGEDTGPGFAESEVARLPTPSR